MQNKRTPGISVSKNVSKKVSKKVTKKVSNKVSEKVRKKVRADIEKERQAKKARDKKAGRYMDHWGNWRTTGKPNPADELTQDFNKESIDKEELKRLMHKKDLDNRHRRKAERAAERTAKTKRKFGPNKPSETAMARAMRIAQKKKRKK